MGSNIALAMYSLKLHLFFALETLASSITYFNAY